MNNSINGYLRFSVDCFASAVSARQYFFPRKAAVFCVCPFLYLSYKGIVACFHFSSFTNIFRHAVLIYGSWVGYSAVCLLEQGEQLERTVQQTERVMASIQEIEEKQTDARRHLGEEISPLKGALEEIHTENIQSLATLHEGKETISGIQRLIEKATVCVREIGSKDREIEERFKKLIQVLTEKGEELEKSFCKNREILQLQERVEQRILSTSLACKKCNKE